MQRDGRMGQGVEGAGVGIEIAEGEGGNFLDADIHRRDDLLEILGAFDLQRVVAVQFGGGG